MHLRYDRLEFDLTAILIIISILAIFRGPKELSRQGWSLYYFLLLASTDHSLQNLAWHEMRTILVAVLLHFDLKLDEGSSDWTDQKIYTLWEKKPLGCTLTSAKA